MKIKQLDTILPGFAALDLGATNIHAAAASTPVTVFGTTTAELRRLCAWLTAHGAHRVAFRSHGRLLDAKARAPSPAANT